jgi:hypothetical protein
MSARPHNGRIAPRHSLSLALAIGVLVASIAFIIFVMCDGAKAAPACMQWPAMEELLADAFGEVPIGGGVINGQTILQIVAGPDGRSFTVVVVDTSGQACTILFGTGWEPGKNPAKPVTAKPERQG